jgi:hypothetical protein
MPGPTLDTTRACRVDAPALVPVSAGEAPVGAAELGMMRRLLAGMMLQLCLGEAAGCRRQARPPRRTPAHRSRRC